MREISKADAAYKEPLVLMFSGQGSQYHQMGRALFDRDRTFSDAMHQMDVLARTIGGRSVLATLYGPRGKGDVFDDITLTHPAIFMVEYALACSLIARGVRPDYTLGVSLGSVAAAAVSGCITMEDGLELVVRQAMTLASGAPRGSMIAVLAGAQQIASKPWHHRCEIAAVNHASHVVISAPAHETEEIEQALRNEQWSYVRLPVPYPFHSRWMDPLRPALHAVQDRMLSVEATVPLVCCASGRVLRQLPADYFWHVARQPIQFGQAISALETIREFRYLDAGPGGTLATLLKYVLPTNSRSTIQAVMTPFGDDASAFDGAVEWATA